MTTFFWTKYPFVRVGIAFILGIFIAYYLVDLPEFKLSSTQTTSLHLAILLLCIGSLFIFYTHRQLKLLLMLLVFFAMGFFRFILEDPRYSLFHIDHEVVKQIDGIQGSIVSEPQFKNDKTNFTLSLDFIHQHQYWKKTQGLIKVYVKGKQHYLLGQGLLLKGKLNPIASAETTFDFNYAQYLAFQKIHYTIYPHRAYLFKSKRNDLFLLIKRQAIFCRDYIESIIHKSFINPQHQNLLIGLLTGSRTNLSQEDKALFTNSGTIHLLAISGMHIVLLYQVVLFLFIHCRIPSKNSIANLFILSLIWFYIFITGLQASTVRAGIMVSIVLIGKILHKNPQHMNSLFATAFIMLLYNPFYIADIGFCLSFLAIVGIILVSSLEIEQTGFKKYLLNATAISTGAQITTLPYAVFLFQQFPVYFLIANLILVPLTTIMMIGALAFVCCHQIPYLSIVFVPVLTWMCDFLFYILHLLNQLPFHLLTHLYITTWDVLLMYLLFTCIIVALATKKKKSLWAIYCLVCLLSFSMHAKINSAYHRHSMLISGSKESRQYVIVYNTSAYILKKNAETKNTFATEKMLSQHLVKKETVIPLPQQDNFQIKTPLNTMWIDRKEVHLSSSHPKKTRLCIIDYKNKSSYITPEDKNLISTNPSFVYANGKQTVYIKNLSL